MRNILENTIRIEINACNLFPCGHVFTIHNYYIIRLISFYVQGQREIEPHQRDLDRGPSGRDRESGHRVTGRYPESLDR